MKQCPFRSVKVKKTCVVLGYEGKYNTLENLDCMGDECEIWNESIKRCNLVVTKKELLQAAIFDFKLGDKK